MKTTKSIQMHLENITVDALMDFRTEAFMSFASSIGAGGKVELGVNAIGQFVVRTKDETKTYNNPAIAIERYTELITEKAQQQ